MNEPVADREERGPSRIAAGGIVAAIVLPSVVAILVIRVPPLPQVPDTNLPAIFQSQVLAFAPTTSDPKDQQELKDAQAQYDSSRGKAVDKARSTASCRSSFEIASHLASALALIASFIISFLGASKGVELSAPPTKEQVKALGRDQAKLRKRVLLLSAVAALCAAAADRLSAQAAKSSANAREVVHIIESTDSDVQRALGAKDIRHAAQKLDLEIATR